MEIERNGRSVYFTYILVEEFIGPGGGLYEGVGIKKVWRAKPRFPGQVSGQKPMSFTKVGSLRGGEG